MLLFNLNDPYLQILPELVVEGTSMVGDYCSLNIVWQPRVKCRHEIE